jgi:hypothetical protein
MVVKVGSEIEQLVFEICRSPKQNVIQLCLSKISKCLSGKELFSLSSSWGMLFPQPDHEGQTVGGLVDAGEHNSHDASVSTANCKGPK